jgi:hypothetical protein
MILLLLSGAWREVIHEKNPEAKNLVTMSLFKGTAARLFLIFHPTMLLLKKKDLQFFFKFGRDSFIQHITREILPKVLFVHSNNTLNALVELSEYTKGAQFLIFKMKIFQHSFGE